VQGKPAIGLKSFGTVASTLAGALLLLGLYSLMARSQLQAPDQNATSGVGAALKPYAYQLFTTYLLPVQVMGFLLLAAMLGVIVLSKKEDAQ
jgi:NADH-quinone oxidoreductase subunit J